MGLVNPLTAGLVKEAGKAGVTNPIFASAVGSSLAALGPGLLDALLGRGGALRSPQTATGTSSKFTIPQADVTALYNYVEKRNTQIAAINNATGSDIPYLDAKEILSDTIARNNAALEEATRRSAYETRVRGEQENIKQAIASLGGIGQSKEQTLQSAINKVLQQDPVGSNQALANLAKGF